MTFSLVTGVVWASSDSPEDASSVTAARGSDAAGGGAPPFRRAPHKPQKAVPASHAPLVHSRPVKVAVPAIFIEAPVTGLALDRKGRLGAPPLSKPKLVGWYSKGPSPERREPHCSSVTGTPRRGRRSSSTSTPFAAGTR